MLKCSFPHSAIAENSIPVVDLPDSSFYHHCSEHAAVPGAEDTAAQKTHKLPGTGIEPCLLAPGEHLDPVLAFLWP